MAGLIKLKLNPTSSDWAHLHLNQLLDLTDPKLLFSSLLSLFNSLTSSKNNIKSNQTNQNINQQEQQTKKFQSEISQILSIRLLQPHGLNALLQSVITEDYHDEEHDHEHDNNNVGEKLTRSNITSATLKRFESIYFILSHPPSNISPFDYWDNILRNLIEIIIPEFFHQPDQTQTQRINQDQQEGKNDERRPLRIAPDQIRKTACFVLSQIIVRQPVVYKKYLSPFIHSAFRPTTSSDNQPSGGEEAEEEVVIISSSKLNQSIQLLNQLVSNSDPSHVLIDRLILPILPQLLSLILFSFRTKADPILRQSAQDLIQIWIQINSSSSTNKQTQDQPDTMVAEWIRRAIRELEIGKELNLNHLQQQQQQQRDDIISSSKLNRWARDDEALCCIKLAPFHSHQFHHPSLDFSVDIDALICWFLSLNHHYLGFIGLLLAHWLNEVQILRKQSGFNQAKMTLFRIQVSLKILENFDPSKIIKDPTQLLNFVNHSLIINNENKKKKIESKVKSKIKINKNQSMNLDSLKFIDLNDENDMEDENRKEDLEAAAGEEEEDLDDGILLTGLTLLFTIIEANPDMNQLNTPILNEISARLDDILLLNKSPTSKLTQNNPNYSEIYDLGIKIKLIISVRKALAQVDQLHNNDNDNNDNNNANANVNVQEQQVKKEIKLLDHQFIEGLKLIESDCIPIRSQGISILKQVLLTNINNGDNHNLKKKLNTWASQVIPILLRLIEEEDSFIYLNSIKALSSLAEKYHDLVCFKLNLGFSGSHDSQNNSLDRRLRIGEAIVQVIQRAGSALPIYIDKLLPSLLIVLSSSSTATTTNQEKQNNEEEEDIIKLKSSALSILSTCIETSFLTMWPYLSDLIQSCLTILISSSNPSSKSKKTQENEEEEGDEEEEEIWNQDTDRIPSSSAFDKVPRRENYEGEKVLGSIDDAHLDDIGQESEQSNQHVTDQHCSSPKNQRGQTGTENNTLKRPAMYLIDRFLNQIYLICSSNSHSNSPQSHLLFLIKKIHLEFSKDLADLHRVLHYFQLSLTSIACPPDLVLHSLLLNSLDALEFILRFFSSFNSLLSS